MFADLLLAAAFQVGPFYEQRPAEDYYAVRPFYACEGEADDVLWPVFTSHRDWWRFCFLMHYQSQDDGGWQFEFLPFWFSGHKPARGEGAAEDYWGLFPIYGHHPHVLLMYDLDFALWPVWTRYRMPRPSEGKWLTTNTVLFPFFSWRDDGAWSFWPFYGINHQRESDHQYALWPIVTWANYREDRDTGGAGSSWMFWPLYGQVRRERERQDLFLPPFFSWTETYSKSWAAHMNSAPEMRLRCPWPIFEWESNARRERLSIWPLYEHVDWRTYSKGDGAGSVTRFGFRLRNRITSGLAVATVVVEAPEKSGALLFADDAVAQGREVFAVPGNADSRASVGSNALLKDGARPATCAWDVLSDFRRMFPGTLHENIALESDAPVPEPPPETGSGFAQVRRPVAEKRIDKPQPEAYIDLEAQLKSLTTEQLQIVAAIDAPGTQVDLIIEKTQLPASKVLAELTVLQIRGVVRQEPGKRFSLNVRAGTAQQS